MDIKYFDDTHLMLYPCIAQMAPDNYYFYHHNNGKFINPDDILQEYNYLDRYTFQGVERPQIQHSKIVENTKKSTYEGNIITQRDIDTLNSFLSQELQSQGIK